MLWDALVSPDKLGRREAVSLAEGGEMTPEDQGEGREGPGVKGARLGSGVASHYSVLSSTAK